jgi:serine/tyrosine/threonine adenylyltransferase
VKSREALEAALERYRDTYAKHFRDSLAQKLGLDALDRSGDSEAMETLFELLGAAETDMTIFFRTLAEVDDIDAVRAALYDSNALSSSLAARWEAWLRWRRKRIESELSAGSSLSMERRRAQMNRVNPCYVPRNYLLQLAIDAATQGDLAPLEELRQVLGNPYEKRAGFERYAAHRPDWARDRPGCSALSCSS